MATEVKCFTIWEKNGKTTDTQSTYRIVKETDFSFYLEVRKMKEVGEFYWERIGNDYLGWSSMSCLVTSDTFQYLFIN